MSYIENNKRNLIMYIGLGLSLVGIALYDHFGILFTGRVWLLLQLGCAACLLATFIQMKVKG